MLDPRARPQRLPRDERYRALHLWRLKLVKHDPRNIAARDGTSVEAMQIGQNADCAAEPLVVEDRGPQDRDLMTTRQRVGHDCPADLSGSTENEEFHRELLYARDTSRGHRDKAPIKFSALPAACNTPFREGRT